MSKFIKVKFGNRINYVNLDNVPIIEEVKPVGGDLSYSLYLAHQVEGYKSFTISEQEFNEKVLPFILG